MMFRKLIQSLRFFVFALILLPTFACAGETWADINLTSYHIHPRRSMNQLNYGAGIEYHPSDDVLYMAGAYRNSEDVTSVYALAGWTPIRAGMVRVGAVAGAMNGYDGVNNGGFAPAVAGLVRIEGQRAGMNILIIPPLGGYVPWALGFQAKFKF